MGLNWGALPEGSGGCGWTEVRSQEDQGGGVGLDWGTLPGGSGGWDSTEVRSPALATHHLVFGQ